ncbi:MAG: cobalamin-binding protein [Anaerolineaceae bacterium]|nr:cobalamin-binding protein [Anaerolineaceae bacterium]
MNPRLLLLVSIVLLLAACQPAAVTTVAPTTPVSAPATLEPTIAPSAIPSDITAARPTDAVAQQSVPPAITDGLGRQVQLAGLPKRIVSLAPSNTEILYALGAGSTVVGRDDFSDYPVQAKSLPTVGGSMGKYNLEQIASLKPDLVLAAGVNTADQVKAIEDLGLTVFYLANPTDLQGLYDNLKTVSQLTGKSAQVRELVGSLQKRVQTVEKKLANVTAHPDVYYELDATDPAKPYTSGAGTFVDQLITQAGGENVAVSIGNGWAQISSEELLVKNPEVILLGDAAYGVTPASLLNRPGWDAINAVKNHRVYIFDDNLVSRPTPRLVDGLETLAKLIHPEIP